MNRNKDNDANKQLSMASAGELIERAVTRAVATGARIVRPARPGKIPKPEALVRARLRAKHNQARLDRDRRAVRVAAGLCIRCGKYPPARPRKQCETCLDQLLEYKEARKARASQ